MKEKNNVLDFIIGLIILIAFLGAFNVIPNEFSATIIELLISAIPGAITSIASAIIVENITGNNLKKITLNYNFQGLPISITVFTITTLLVKIFVFGI